MWRWVLIAGGLVACAGARPAERPVAPPVLIRAVWVDASAAEGGDGTSARPWRRLEQALKGAGAGTRIDLAAGLYEGPFELPSGVFVRGGSATVLFREGAGGPVVRAAAGVRLTRVRIQGGAEGLESTGEVTAEDVELTGQRGRAIRHRSGTLRLRDVSVRASVSEGSGLVLEPGAKAEIEGSRFEGPWRRGIEVGAGASLRVHQTRFVGPVTAIHSERGQVRLRAVEVEGGRGPALFASGGRLVGRHLTLLGHEYGVLARAGAEVELDDVVTVRAERAGIGLVGARARVGELVVIESGSFGGVQQTGGELELSGFRILRPGSYGLVAVDGATRARDGVIAWVADPGGGAGDGIQIRRGKLAADAVTVTQTAGAGILVAEGAKVRLRALELEKNAWGGVLAESEGRVDAASLTISGSPAGAISVPGQARVRITALESLGNASAVWAECQAGAEVLLGFLRGEPKGTDAPCVGRWTRPLLEDPFQKPRR